MNVNKFIAIIAITLVIDCLFVSCNVFPVAVAEPHFDELIPGECLNSHELQTACEISSSNGYLFCISIDLDLDIETKPELSSYTEYRRLPSDRVFDSFLKSAKLVRDAYEEAYTYKCTKADSFLPHCTTIFYDKGIVLTANKEFAGHPAGENLIPFFNISGGYGLLYPKEKVNGAILLPSDMDYDSIVAGKSIISFPIGNYSVVSERTEFELSIPVKVGMYLKWLYDRQSNPEAPIQLDEVVLHGSCISSKSLR